MSTYEPSDKGRTDTEHATVAEDSTKFLVELGPRWKGPFTEYNRYGEPTGAEYVRCSSCGVEVLAGETRHATHRDECPLDD